MIRSVFEGPMAGSPIFPFKILQQDCAPVPSSSFKWTADAVAGRNTKVIVCILSEDSDELHISYFVGFWWAEKMKRIGDSAHLRSLIVQVWERWKTRWQGLCVVTLYYCPSINHTLSTSSPFPPACLTHTVSILVHYTTQPSCYMAWGALVILAGGWRQD